MGLVTASPVGVAAGWFSVEESKMSLYLSILFSLSPSLCLLLSVSLSLCVCFPAPHGGIQHHPRNRASNATSLTDKNAVIHIFSGASGSPYARARSVFRPDPVTNATAAAPTVSTWLAASNACKECPIFAADGDFVAVRVL